MNNPITITTSIQESTIIELAWAETQRGCRIIQATYNTIHCISLKTHKERNTKQCLEVQSKLEPAKPSLFHQDKHNQRGTATETHTSKIPVKCFCHPSSFLVFQKCFVNNGFCQCSSHLTENLGKWNPKVFSGVCGVASWDLCLYGADRSSMVAHCPLAKQVNPSGSI